MRHVRVSYTLPQVHSCQFLAFYRHGLSRGLATDPGVSRNLRPYFKFTLPQLTVNADEARVWEGLRGGTAVMSEVWAQGAVGGGCDLRRRR